MVKYHFPNSLQPLDKEVTAQVVTFALKEAHVHLKGEWKCVTTTSGELYVVVDGTPLMLMWCVDSWDMYPLVSSRHLFTWQFLCLSVLTACLSHSTMHAPPCVPPT